MYKIFVRWRLRFNTYLPFRFHEFWSGLVLQSSAQLLDEILVRNIHIKFLSRTSTFCWIPFLSGNVPPRLGCIFNNNFNTILLKEHSEKESSNFVCIAALNKNIVLPVMLNNELIFGKFKCYWETYDWLPW